MENVQTTIAKQMDLRWEAYSLQRFKRNFSHEDEILSSSLSFPDLHGRLVAEAVLVESWAPGTTVADMFPRLADRSWHKIDLEDASPEHLESTPGIPSPQILKRRLARQVMDLAMKMFLRDNYIHGDMHAGNLLYSPQQNLLSVLDTGLTAEVPPQSADAFGEFLRGICFNDSDLVAEKLVEFHDPGAKGKTPDLGRLKSELRLAFNQLFEEDLVRRRLSATRISPYTSVVPVHPLAGNTASRRPASERECSQLRQGDMASRMGGSILRVCNDR